MPEPTLPLVLESIEADTAGMLRAERETVEVGPFLAAFHRTSDMIWMNYAVPIAPTEDAATVRSALPRLQAEFQRRNRTLRFEYLAARHPALAVELERFGLGLQITAPLMFCTPANVRSFPPQGFELHRLQADPQPPAGHDASTANSSNADLADFLRVGKLSFGADDNAAAVEPHEIDELRDALRRNRWRCILARVGGIPVGVGTFCTGNSELAGVGTLPAFRRKGIAAALSSALLAEHFAAGGGRAWLSAADHVARALYAKIGFQDAGVQLNYMAAEPLRAS
jgi:ribosomal protein S18 acetylase RimI-like enzyme